MSNRAALERQLNAGLPVTRRGRRFLEFDAGNGQRRLVLTVEPLHYGPAADTEIDTAFEADTGAFQWKMVRSDFEARTRSVFNAGNLIEFRRGAEWVVLNPLSLNWINQDNSTQQIATTAAVTGAVSDDAITWTNGFGTGRHFTYRAHPSQLLKEITIASAANLPAPTVTGTIWLMAEFQMTNSANVDLWIDGVRWARTSGVRVQTASRIEFRNVTTGVPLWSFDVPDMTDAAGQRITGLLEVRRQGPNYFAAVRIPRTWIADAARVYPLVLDPTLTTQPDATAGIDTFTQSNAADTSNATSGFIFTYNAYFGGTRIGLLKFDLSSIPGGSTVTSATLSLYYSSTGSGEANVTVEAHQVLSANSAWAEGSTWNYKTPSTVRWAGDAASNGGADAGCSVSGTDFSATVDGSNTWTTVPADDSERTFTITTSRMEAMIAANYGWALTCTSAKSATFRSSDDGTSSRRPKLVVNYTTGGSPQTVTPSPVAVPVSPVAPTLINVRTVTPSPIAVPLAIPAPSLTQVRTLTPSPVALPLVLPAPNVSGAAPAQSVTPSPVVVPLAVPAPTITTGAVMVSPSPVAVALATPAPTVVRGAVSVAPSPIQVLVTIAAPVVRTVYTVTPSPVTIVLVTPVPSLTFGPVTLSPSPVAVVLAVVTPTVRVGARPGTVGVGDSAVYSAIGIGSTLLHPIGVGESGVGSVAVGASQGGGP